MGNRRLDIKIQSFKKKNITISHIMLHLLQVLINVGGDCKEFVIFYIVVDIRYIIICYSILKYKVITTNKRYKQRHSTRYPEYVSVRLQLSLA